MARGFGGGRSSHSHFCRKTCCVRPLNVPRVLLALTALITSKFIAAMYAVRGVVVLQLRLRSQLPFAVCDDVR